MAYLSYSSPLAQWMQVTSSGKTQSSQNGGMEISTPLSCRSNQLDQVMPVAHQVVMATGKAKSRYGQLMFWRMNKDENLKENEN